MLEIIFLIWFARKLASIAKGKGRSGGWGGLGVGLWFGGEILGFIVGTMTGAEGAGAYGFAILFAAIGAVASYAIVNSLASLMPEEGETRAFGEHQAVFPVDAPPQDLSNPYTPPRTK
jgi:hypothetical protein